MIIAFLPLCGGEDRFHVRDSGGRAAVGCRGCIDGQPDGERAARFGELLRAAFPDRAVTPARAYLAGRSVWPPDGIGPGLPDDVRWLPRGAVGRDVAADWYDVPAHAAGAIVYAFRQPGGATIRAVGLDALEKRPFLPICKLITDNGKLSGRGQHTGTP